MKDEEYGRGDRGKLSLFDACAMAIGGMVGGGIFAVLGTAALQAGNAAFLAFGLAGLLALLTGLSYAKLTVDFDEPGGSFSYVEHIVGPRTAGTVSWFLVLGYLFTISLYAVTFGAYTARLLGLTEPAIPVLGAAVIFLLAGLNLVGVRESGIAEDILVAGKMIVLVVVGSVGLLAVEPREAFPVLESGTGSAVAAAALIFVAYEGFQLLTYDYADIEDHRRNLLRAVWISIPVVIATYVLVAFVTTGALPDQAIAQHGETVLASVARPVLGRVGLVAVLVAAVFSTASAINATLFASARLGLRVAEERQLPAGLMSWSSPRMRSVSSTSPTSRASLVSSIRSRGSSTRPRDGGRVFVLPPAVPALPSRPLRRPNHGSSRRYMPPVPPDTEPRESAGSTPPGGGDEVRRPPAS